MAAVPSIGRASLVEPAGRAPQAAATAGLYERHAAKILSYCLHQLGSREEAEDAVQTTFMNAFRALGRGVVPEAESAWLFKIAENVCLSRRRSSWRRGRIESPSDFDVIEEIVPGPSGQSDELIGIEDALASMPEQQRRAILLREWQGLSYREVAEELEVSQSAVETLIFRARRSLAQGLEQPDTLKRPKRKSFRRAMHVIDLGTIAAALKTLLAGSAAVKATAAAVAVTAAAGTAAGVSPKLEGKRHGTVETPAPALVAPAAAQPAPAAPFVAAPVVEPRAAIAAPAAAAGPVRKPKKRAEKATAKPPVHTRAAPAAPVEQTPAPEPAAEPVAAPVPVQPAVEPPHAAGQPADKKRGEGRKDEPKRNDPPPEAPAPSAVVAPISLTDPTAGQQPHGKKDKVRGNDKRQLAGAPVPPPATTEPVVTEPAPATEAPAVEPAPAEEQGEDKGAHGAQNGKGRGK
ncbi:MAG TPA: sigma-70 family RNA polymerase sigma factor [Gaiellaceae bacterium]|nr:sigma-70 family RNA polymerase sigma factor [Gaiellaceae bacterium]